MKGTAVLPKPYFFSPADWNSPGERLQNNGFGLCGTGEPLTLKAESGVWMGTGWRIETDI